MTVSVLVTGGTGFLGSFIVNAILEQHPDWAVTVIDVASPKENKKGVKYELGDVTVTSTVNAVLERAKPQVIVHTAGMVPELAERYGRNLEAKVFKINVEGTRTLLAAAKEHGVKAFVWTGSCTAVMDDMTREYPNIDEAVPTSHKSTIYGESKAAAEALVLGADDEHISTCSLRPSVIFGEGDYQLIPSIHACIAKGEMPFVVGDGYNMWDVTYVGNIADAHVLAVENLLTTKTAAGEAIFIANEEPITFRDFCLAIWAAFGYYPSYTIHIPVTIAAFAGFVAEWATWVAGSSATLSRGSVFDACATRYCSGAKARNLLGYQPRVGLEEGLRVSCAEYAQRLKLQASSKKSLRGSSTTTMSVTSLSKKISKK